MSGRIKQPKNVRIKAQNAAVDLVWKQTFGREQSDMLSSVQKFIDSECIRLMRPYTPARSETLSESAVLDTKAGSGEIKYLIPYARYQYYGKLMVSGVTGSSYARHGESKTLTDRNLNYSTFRHPKAQKMWFEAMKADHKEQILRGAAAIARRK